MYIDVQALLLISILVKSYIVVIGITVILCKRKKIAKYFKNVIKEYK